MRVGAKTDVDFISLALASLLAFCRRLQRTGFVVFFVLGFC